MPRGWENQCVFDCPLWHFGSGARDRAEVEAWTFSSLRQPPSLNFSPSPATEKYCFKSRQHLCAKPKLLHTASVLQILLHPDDLCQFFSLLTWGILSVFEGTAGPDRASSLCKLHNPILTILQKLSGLFQAIWRISCGQWGWQDGCREAAD